MEMIITIGRTVTLAMWIIDDLCLVSALVVKNMQQNFS